jgi:hypothetical protein
VTAPWPEFQVWIAPVIDELRSAATRNARDGPVLIPLVEAIHLTERAKLRLLGGDPFPGGFNHHAPARSAKRLNQPPTQGIVPKPPAADSLLQIGSGGRGH